MGNTRILSEAAGLQTVILKVLAKESSVVDIAEEYGVARKTIYKWLKRYQTRGLTGLVDESRRPLSSPMKTSAELALEIVRRQARDRRSDRRLRGEIRDTKSDYDKEKLQERLAKLSGGVAVIRIGAATEAEAKSRKEALEDAISATKAAVAEGIVPGCGLALLRAIEAVKLEEKTAEGDERTGLKILARALEAPTRTIADNSGFDDGVVVERMRAGTGNHGFDAARGVYCDLVEAGIIDPTKVVRMGLENAVSVASVLLLSEATMTDLPEPVRVSAEHVEP